MIRMLIISLAIVGLVSCGETRKIQSDDIVSTPEIGTDNAIKKGTRVSFLSEWGKLYVVQVEGGKQCYWSTRKPDKYGTVKRRYTLMRSDHDYHATLALRRAPYYWCEDIVSVSATTRN